MYRYINKAIKGTNLRKVFQSSFLIFLKMFFGLLNLKLLSFFINLYYTLVGGFTVSFIYRSEALLLVIEV